MYLLSAWSSRVSRKTLSSMSFISLAKIPNLASVCVAWSITLMYSSFLRLKRELMKGICAERANTFLTAQPWSSQEFALIISSLDRLCRCTTVTLGTPCPKQIVTLCSWFNWSATKNRSILYDDALIPLLYPPLLLCHILSGESANTIYKSLFIVSCVFCVKIFGLSYIMLIMVQQTLNMNMQYFRLGDSISHYVCLYMYNLHKSSDWYTLWYVLS